MKKKFINYFICCTYFLCTSLFAQGTLPSPAQYLGYAIGEKYTPHHRVLAYAEQIARQAPTRIKVIPYGTTYEGRQLAVVAIGNEANIARLEEIRTDNLRRIGMLAGKPSGKAMPAIQWLSYNVHGNEAVSSEAFMEVVYGLLEPTKAGSQYTVSPKILETSIVILDPGLNPDGHDRYVNWYNQMQGRVADPTPFSREHSEPWPGGRYTHYYFDPNRDWAWQTQEITQQRMALYQQWMPHLHGDFHEMGYNSPYYFAPSAKPYHEDITPFQRQFQTVVGQYCSRYFDRNNWLYYTRERFDLFYPSYGDTYPTYNGAIGMTYEQGGNSRAGLAVRKDDGDTLTLRERIDHHVAASFATLESVADRSAEVVKEFGSFFDKAQNSPVGVYKTYVVKSNGDEGKLNALRQLLDKNRIVYGTAGKAQTISAGAATKGKSSGTLRSESAGIYNYLTQKNEKNVSIAEQDLVISAYQPKSTLLKILFEPKSMLEDSVTYDITAWSLPYAYGLQTYALTNRVDPVATATKPATAPASAVDRPYAYLAKWQSLPSVQLLASLMTKKIRVRTAEKPFELNGQQYTSGTLLITRAGNERLGNRFDALVKQEAAALGVALTPVATGFVTKGSDFGSDFVTVLKAPRVAVVSGEGTVATSVGEVWHYFDQELKYPVSMINGSDLGSVDWKQVDVLILANGYAYGRLLNDRTLSAIREWIRGGGKLIAMERAAAAFIGKEGFDLKEKEEKGDQEKGKGKKALTDSLKTYAERERSAVSDETPGSIYRLDLDTTHPLGFGLSGGYYTLVQDAHTYDILKDGWNVGYLKDSNLVAGFAGKNAKEKLKQTLAIGVQELGRGQVIYLADNPLFRGFWYNGKLLFGNAVFMSGN